MSKKVIVLADNSYTIRRIVELSFSEIENIEVRSFDNGSGIKEKLLQLAPAMVIVDIKLPEVNGYDVCRFVNETPALGHTRVFLMKGSFEPVDSEMLKNLRYEDIVTKPFDSNALVGAVMKIVNQEAPAAATAPAGEQPSSFPEEFPEIETESPEGEDISFSDIRGEMDAPQAFARPSGVGAAPERDEILPSEEITQGTQPLKDNLMPQETEEPIKNPFEEEPAFEEIHAAPPAPPRTPLEYAQSPSPPAADGKDASDEFHERFLEIAGEDAPDDLLKAPSLAEGEEFPSDAREQSSSTKENLSIDFERMDADSPAKTMYAGPLEIDFLDADRKPPPAKGPDLPEGKAHGKERPAEKAKAESLSPQDQLEQLTGMTKRESKAETAPPPPAGKFELTGKIEEKLNQTIKELLWEIVPPLAEKLIKDEIDKIKSDLNDSSL